MNGWGAFLLGGGLVGLTLYVHKRRLTWVALALGLFAGVLIAVSTLGRWVADLGEKIPYVPLIIVIAGLVVIGLDIRDKRPDKPSVLFAIIVPMFFAAGIGQLPQVITEIGAAFSQVGSETPDIVNQPPAGR
jgi:hypothetical protein